MSYEGNKFGADMDKTSFNSSNIGDLLKSGKGK